MFYSELFVKSFPTSYIKHFFSLDPEFSCFHPDQVKIFNFTSSTNLKVSSGQQLQCYAQRRRGEIIAKANSVQAGPLAK